MIAVISTKQMYPGQSTQVLAAVAGCTSGHFRSKIIIVVDDDMSMVWWAISMRTDPERSVQVVRRTRDTVSNPGVYFEQRGLGSKLLLDATIPFEWRRKPIATHLDPDTEAKVLARWKEYGIDEPITDVTANIAQELEMDSGFMFPSGLQSPDFQTIYFPALRMLMCSQICM